jgi:hypothetical protein
MRSTVSIGGRDHQLEAEPMNASFREVVAHLNKNIAHPIWVHLEPGDGTRYEFLLMPQHHIYSSEFGRGIPTWGPERWLLAVRFRGGYAIGSACVQKGCGSYDFEDFSRENMHTMIVMEWWFNLLFEALDGKAH